MARSVTPFLMFQNKDAEEAMRFYVSLFEGACILRLDRFAGGGAGPEGTVLHGEIEIAGQAIRFFDSPAKHAFGFTPSSSLFVECRSAAELDRLSTALSEGGRVLMPPDNYGFSERFTWTDDRFGVSWQLNWPGADTGARS
jgi:predicted 3-demethylubiquinone-9 3-methyltransferase (glyoxalase superfamily)